MLSERDLFFIKHWKYKVMDNTITGKLLYPLLDKIIIFIPRYISANLITLIGFIIMSSIFIFIEFYGYDQKYIWIILLCYIISSLLDSLDGKQARRIKNDTPFGELFDHSVDIFTLFVIVRITSYILGLQNFNLIPTYIVIGNIFCYSHYKAYLDGYLTLNKFSGPNEILLLIILLYIFSYFVNVINYVNYNMILYISIIIQIANVIYMTLFLSKAQEQYPRILRMTPSGTQSESPCGHTMTSNNISRSDILSSEAASSTLHQSNAHEQCPPIIYRKVIDYLGGCEGMNNIPAAPRISQFRYQNINIDNNNINIFITNKNILYILILLYYVSIISIYINISYLSIISIFIIINSELIISKMSMRNFKEEIIKFLPICLINGYVSLIISFGYIIIVLYKIKKYMNIPFLATF